jgi:drug/metabolite transporter (DMT)-like permease
MTDLATEPAPEPAPARPGAEPISKGVAIVALVMGAVAMGISPLFVRVSNDAAVGPFASAFWRVFLALPVLGLWAVLEDRASGGRKPTFTRATLGAGLLFTGDLLFWHLSILMTTIANATFFATTAPFWVVGVSWFIFKQKSARGVLAGVGLCVLGGLALIGNSLDIDPSRLKGDLFGLATAFFFGLYFFAITKARLGAGAGRVTFASTAVTAVLLFGVAMAIGDRFIPTTGAGWAALIAMGVVSHAGGQGLLALALGRLPTVFSSLVIFLEAVAAAIAGWALLGEALTLLQSLGGALILAGIWIARPQEPVTPSPGKA